jgi:glutaredoxin
MFSRPGCPHCASAKEYLDQLAVDRPELTVEIHDVRSDPAALERLQELARKHGVSGLAVPSFAICDAFWVGFLDAGTTGARIERLLNGTADPPDTQIELPWFGMVDLLELGLPLFTLAVGLVDGLNPCAMWVLLFLLSILVNLRDRRRIIAIAGTFVFVSGLAYFLFMVAWLNVFLWIGLSRGVQLTLGVIALVVGGVNVKDFFAFGSGLSFSIPAAAKPGIYARVRRIVRAESLSGAIAGAFVLAVLVNLVELLCTAGLPALYTQILTLQQLTIAEYYAYLLLYNLAYVADDAALVTLVVATLGRRKLDETHGRWLKLLSGAVMLLLGGVLLVFPELLVRG